MSSTTLQSAPHIVHQLDGEWHITHSNFSMWTNGSKLNPKFNYRIEYRDGQWGLTDDVSYQQLGKQKHITGYDTHRGDATFTWRGDGFITRWLRSNWRVLAIDPTATWAIIQFEATLFTPAGYDVLARANSLQDWQKQHVDDALNTNNVPPLTDLSTINSA